MFTPDPAVKYPTDPAGIEAEITRQIDESGFYDSQLWCLQFKAETELLTRVAAGLRIIQARSAAS